IRDFHVTGVQTCALPISTTILHTCRTVVQSGGRVFYGDAEGTLTYKYIRSIVPEADEDNFVVFSPPSLNALFDSAVAAIESDLRSEERRVGKEWKSRRRS